MKKICSIFILSFLVSCSTDDNNVTDDIVGEDPILYDFTVKVLDLSDNPVEGATVNLYKAGSQAESTVTNDQGVADFNDLEEGVEFEYEVVSGDVTASGDFILSGKDLTHEVVLEIGGSNFIAQQASIIITGFMADPRGADGARAGTSDEYEDVIVEHDGGYEYIQLMALEDINFEETPYSVVTATNGFVTAKGWAEGGIRSFKFDLTSGEVSKGEFFYVGGKSMVIAGYGPCGKSTDISDANWIRTIDYLTDGGDGFGKPTNGILGNVNDSGVNTADGIAVFEGTEVTPESVPMDAIFFGSKIHAAYNEEEGWGYKVPEKNDLYSAVNPETGEAQPLFGQGTNTTFLSQGPNKDSSEFSLLGGSTSATHWITDRETTVKELSFCPDESSLSDIEEGAGVTVFAD